MARNVEISPTQMEFLRRARKGNHRRSVYDRTANALKKKGLVFYAVMFGWNLTAEGQNALDQLEKNSINGNVA